MGGAGSETMSAGAIVQDDAVTRRGDGAALIGIDVGTSSVRAIAFDTRGRRLAAAARPTPTKIVETGGEYDPEAIFRSVLEALTEVATALAGRPVAGIAVASIGESCVLIDAGGSSLAPSIVWHDRRTEPQARLVENAVGRERIFEIIGHRSSRSTHSRSSCGCASTGRTHSAGRSAC